MPESTVELVLDRIKQAFAIESWLNFPMVVAVSGGPDSVALLRLLVQLKRSESIRSTAPLLVAHVNHGLRGANSDADETTVGQISDTLGLKCFVTRLSKQVRKSEEQLRDARYRFLLKLAHEQGARLIATGHQADDQVETILFRIFRGTGIGGLVGVPQFHALDDTVSLVRPLLNVTRREIEAVLQELNQTYCIDESNDQTHYARNFLRHQIIPDVISKFGSQFPTNLQRLALQANEVEAFLSQQALQFADCVLARTNREVKIYLQPLIQQPKLVVRQFLKQVWTEQGWPQQEMGFNQWQQLSEMVIPNNRTVKMFPGNIRCEVIGTELVLKKSAPG